MNRSLALVAVAGAMTLSACSSDASDASAQSATSTSSTTAETQAPTSTSSEGTAVTITADDRTFDATINSSQVSQDFLATLPTTLSWERNGGIEYIAELEEPLTETGPFYTDVEAGDIVYYNPMDSITIIYAPTSSVPTLTKMGEVTSDLAGFEDLPDDVELRIALASG